MRAGGVSLGLGLMISGWLLALAALVLLPGFGGRMLFACAGMLVDLLGLGLLLAGSRPQLKPRAVDVSGGRR